MHQAQVVGFEQEQVLNLIAPHPPLVWKKGVRIEGDGELLARMSNAGTGSIVNQMPWRPSWQKSVQIEMAIIMILKLADPDGTVG